MTTSHPPILDPQQLLFERALVEGMQDGVALFDAHQQTMLVNTAMERMTGLPRTAFDLTEFTRLCAPHCDVPHLLDRALREMRTTTLEEGVPIARFTYQLAITPWYSPDGALIGVVLVLHDITHLQEVARAKTEFIALASHQLRTPLTTINWYIEMLCAPDAGTLTDQQRAYCEEIARSSQRMVALVNALLNVSRIELGTLAMETEPTDIRAFARSVTADLQPTIAHKRLVIRASYDPAIPEIPADPKLLRIVVQNVVENAVRYTPAGGSVAIAVAVARAGATVNGQVVAVDSVAMTVTDTGCGIPDSQRGKIFTKLFRADNARLLETDGNGLGLYLARAILDAVGGRIWFTSEEGKGSTFTVTLPLTGMQSGGGGSSSPS